MSAVISSAVETKGSFWTATSLIAGTCIGGGMLAMPVQTAETGFFLSAMALLASWFFMTFTGLLLVEATLWVKNETHFASLSRILLGNGAKVIALSVYLFMNYASLVAYIAGGSALINSWFAANGLIISYEMACVLFTSCFGLIVFLGAHFIGKLNFIFVIGLCVCYLGLVSIGIGNIQQDYLTFRSAWKACFGTFSMILATFSYQMVVPSVCSYMNYDREKLKKAVIVGTTIPLIVYVLWIFVIHGAVPLDGENSLREAFANGSSATVPLRAHLQHWSLVLMADVFAFFAVATSYLGLSLALFHFLSDCFRELKLEIGRNLIIFLTIIPALILAVLFPRALLQSLDISGGFGDTILSGLIPIAMVYVGRYKKGLGKASSLFSGRAVLAIAACFFSFVLIKECYSIFLQLL
jgi:tyrosine-specific transport protein